MFVNRAFSILIASLFSMLISAFMAVWLAKATPAQATELIEVSTASKLDPAQSDIMNLDISRYIFDLAASPFTDFRVAAGKVKESDDQMVIYLDLVNRDDEQISIVASFPLSRQEHADSMSVVSFGSWRVLSKTNSDIELESRGDAMAQFPQTKNARRLVFETKI